MDVALVMGEGRGRGVKSCSSPSLVQVHSSTVFSYFPVQIETFSFSLEKSVGTVPEPPDLITCMTLQYYSTRLLNSVRITDISVNFSDL